MSEHEERADALEREIDDMQRQSKQLSDEIGGIREDWRSKQRDESIPGAVRTPAEGDAEETARAEDSTSEARDQSGEDEYQEPPPEAQEPPGD